MSNFNMHRLAQLIKVDLLISKKTILVGSATLIVILALFPFHVTASLSPFFMLVYLGGFIMTSYAFSEMHDSRKAFQYLTLPCSNLERFLSKWLLTAVIFPLAVLVLYYLFSWISVVANILLFDRSVSLFDLTQPVLWVGLGKYVILQSIILLGAAYFKKNVLLKTVLTLGCFLIAVALLMMVIAWIFCPSCYIGGTFDAISISLHGSYFIFWIVLAPFCWWVTYLRITDSEIN